MGIMRFIDSASLIPVLDQLAGHTELWVPAASGKDGRVVRFQRYGDGIVPVFDCLTRVSPKEIVQPQVECLLRFEYVKGAEQAASIRLTVDDPVDAARPCLVFGARPCDVRAFALTDLVFRNGPVVDSYYKSKRENTLFATLVCREGDSACFCSAVGGGPAELGGSDLGIIPVEGGLVVEALQDRASALIEGVGEPVSASMEASARKVVAEVSRRCVGNLDTEDLAAAFKNMFEARDYWRDVAERCLSCGVCTFVCPTCYCFTITDEMRNLHGERLRSWDSCMFCQYTLEASGHNPRPTKLERYRNRVGHKFCYFPEKYDGKFSCTGCGRCIRSCPVAIDIRQAVAGLKEKVCACT